MVKTKHVAPKTPKPTKTWFQSLAAKERFDNVFVEKCFILDKGFHQTCVEAPHGLDSLARVVNTWQWVRFCAPRELPDIDIVWEFYANLWENQTSTVLVRGRLVPLSACAINDLFAIPDHAQDGYTSMMTLLDVDTFPQVLRTVALDGTKWTPSRKS